MAISAVNAGGRLDRLPVARFHYRILWLIGAGMFLDGFDIYLAGGVLGALVKSGWSNLASNAQFISMTFAGMFFGAWLSGVLGDRYGRRFSYQFNLLIFGLASLAGAAAPTIGWLIVARFFMGLGLGAEIVVSYVTLSEFVPPQQRGLWGSALATITASSLVVASLVSYIVIPTIGWRWMFVIVAVGALLAWYFRRALPESPRWLESVGRIEEAERVLGAIEAEVAREKPLPPVVNLPAPVVVRPPFTVLFSKELIVRTFVGSVVLIALNTAVWGFIAWLPTFLVKQGMSVVTSLGYSTLISLGGPAGTLIGMWLADRMGRKPGIVVFSLVAIVLGSIYPYTVSPVLITLFGFGLVAAIYIPVTFAFSLYVPELFPTEVRMRGAGFCNTIGRVSSILTPYVVVEAFQWGGVAAVIGVLSFMLLLQAIVVAAFGIETKQRSLEALRPGLAERPLGTGLLAERSEG